MVSWVTWFYECLWFPGFRGIIGLVVLWVSWFGVFRSVIGFMRFHWFRVFIRGGSRIFFRRGCTRLLLHFNTNKPHSFFFWQNTSCIRKPQVISRGGGGAHPLHPPPRSAPVHECRGFKGLAVSWVSFHRFHGWMSFMNLQQGFIGLVVSWDLWSHRFRSFISFMITLVSWVSWFHGFLGFMSFVVSWISWFYRFRRFMGFMVSWVS